MNSWKASDFKVLFFHIMPLSFVSFCRVKKERLDNFYQICLAIRLLCQTSVTHSDIQMGRKLLGLFIKNFVELYGEEMQSYNFHSMRHLCDQVERLGPLWNCSAFGFESANHFLIRALSGTIKTPESIVEIFIKNKWTLEDLEKKRVDWKRPNFGRFQTTKCLYFCSKSYTRQSC